MKLNDLKSIFYKRLQMFDNNECQTMFKQLCASYLDLDPIDIVLNDSLKIPREDQNKFELAIEKLQANEPLQYILGQSYFFGLELKLTPSVLIPRPETEELVAWILEHFESSDAPKILDLGTGSGCIAISLAKHLPKAEVHALDVSPEALEIAKKNAQAHGVQVVFHQQDMTKIKTFNTDFDVIVSNPPYVCQQEKTQMKANVLDYEPHLALFVDDNTPLKFYQFIKRIATRHLKPDGLAFMEINEAYGTEMVQLFEEKRFKNTNLKNDTFGKPRMFKTIKK